MKAFGKIFRESFDVDNVWTDWFLDKVCDKEDIITAEVDGQTASVALLTPYKMTFHGAEIPVCYINSVATARKFRGRGLASQLMIDALHRASARGDELAVLIPANRRLFFFYDSLGFTTVFYIDEQRFTSLHQFEMAEGYLPVTPSWEMFHSLEQLRRYAVRHSRKDYENILTDLTLSSGMAVAVEGPNQSRAMAFFSTTASEVHVLDILATDDAAAEAALHIMRTECEGKSVIVKAMPCGRQAELRSRGMARILNVQAVLQHLAEAHPGLKQTIRVTDRLLPVNSGTYSVRDGRCEKITDTTRRLTLDVSTEVLCEILFSDRRIGEIFDIPTERPFISLMLD